MNVLVVAPHPDDEVLGCGGAVCRHSLNGDTVSVVFLTSGELGLKRLPREEACALREEEARQAAVVLNTSETLFLRLPDWMLDQSAPLAIELLSPILQQTRPDRIYLPHPAEWHPDHRVSLPIVQGALAALRARIPLFGYEVWTPLGQHEVTVDISDLMSRKLLALRKHASQLNEWDYARAIRGLNQYRGAMAGRCRYAEVFQELPAA